MAILVDDMTRFCRNALGFTAGAAAAGMEAIIDSCVDSAIQSFFLPTVLPGEKSAHIWSFLYRYSNIYTKAPYSTGTIESSGTTVTLSGAGAAWPSYTATSAGTIICNDQMHEVVIRNNDTQLTLVRAPETNIAAGSTYELVFMYAELPGKFAGLYGPVNFAPGVGKGPVLETSAANIETLHHNTGTKKGSPEYIAFDGLRLVGTTTDNNNSSKKIKFWPIPDAEYQLHFQYIQHSQNYEDGDDGTTIPLENNIPSYLSLIPDYHADTLYAALSVRISEQFGIGEINGARQYFRERMRDSIIFDRTLQTSKAGDYLGYNGDSSDSRYGRQTSGLYKSDVTATKYSDPLGLGRLL